MEHVEFGRTGMKVSRLCLGTMNFGPRTPEAEADRIINAALDAGINFIDTANLYGQSSWEDRSQGLTEEIIGRSLRRSGRRASVVLGTKVSAPTANYPEDPNAIGAGRRQIIAEAEHSLRRLQTDYLDLYMLHGPQEHIPWDEKLRAFDDLIRSGKVRFIGTCNHPAWHLVESLWTADRLNLNRVVSEQSAYSMVYRRIEQDLIPAAQRHELALMAWSPMWGGLLTGKYRRDTPPPPESRFAFAAWADLYQDAERRVYDLIDLLQELAAEKGCSVSQLALAWAKQQPGITTVIIGPRTLQQLQDNLGAADVTLTAADEARIDAIVPPRGQLVRFMGV